MAARRSADNEYESQAHEADCRFQGALEVALCDQRRVRQDRLQQKGFPVRCSLQLPQDPRLQVPSRLFQPFAKALLGLSLSECPLLGNGDFPTSNTLQDAHALLLKLIALNVNKIGAWQAVLGDQDGLLVAFNVREQIRGLTLECGDEFGTHGVILKCHSLEVKSPTPNPSLFAAERGRARPCRRRTDAEAHTAPDTKPAGRRVFRCTLPVGADLAATLFVRKAIAPRCAPTGRRSLQGHIMD